MTRLTKEMRQNILHKIMSDVPNVDYTVQIVELVQKTIIEVAPDVVKAMYADPELKGYLSRAYLTVRLGNRSVGLYRNGRDPQILGAPVEAYFRVQMDDRVAGKGVYTRVIEALRASRLVTKYFEQKDLYEQVRKRVAGNLEAASTVKRLYDVLEPELHGYIPLDPVKASLPATVAPVVDDLRKLGKELPVVPKAVA